MTTNSNASTLAQFTQPAILESIGHRRLVKLLAHFTEDLIHSPLSFLPSADDSPDFAILASAFTPIDRLPARLRTTLLMIENAAAAENQDRLDNSIQRCIPNVSMASCCPLDQALELWFAAPEELARFSPQPQDLHESPDSPSCPASPVNPCDLPTPQTHLDSTTCRSALPLPFRRGEGRGEGSVCSPSVVPQSHAPIPLLPDDSLAAEATPAVSAPADLAPATTAVQTPKALLTTAIAETKFQPSLFPNDPPWPEPVNGKLLLDQLRQTLSRYAILPQWAAEALTLWLVHTYAFQLRDISTYIGIESPEKRCGKTTLLTVLNELAHRALAASNISPPAFFRVIEELRPTLLIDEADTFLRGNDQLKGILNSGYKNKLAFVLRAAPSTPTTPIPHLAHNPSIQKSTNPSIQPSNPLIQSDNPSDSGAINWFSCWCPKVIAQIGRLPDTLADRCILIRMQRKSAAEQCERLHSLDAAPLRSQCVRFVRDNADAIANATPIIPEHLNDRAAEIWEPLLALADLAGGDWPGLARQAAVGLHATAQEANPISSLLLDIFLHFIMSKSNRLFTADLVNALNLRLDRPWAALNKGKAITDLWLATQLRPYGIRSRTMRIGEQRAKGYLQEELEDVFRRYISKTEIAALRAEWSAEDRLTAPAQSAPCGQASESRNVTGRARLVTGNVTT